MGNSSVEVIKSDFNAAPVLSGPILVTNEQLDYVSGDGGKTGASSNPVED